jgi:hypothetical protein
MMLYPGNASIMKIELPEKRELHSRKSDLEIWLDYHNHEMELVRTLVPIVVLIIQTFILIKVL